MKKVHIYYFDLSFEETVKRHSLWLKRMEFGEESLRSWWNPKDYLGWTREVLLTDDMSQEDVMKLIVDQLQKI